MQESELRFWTLLKAYVHKYVAHTPEVMPHLVMSLLFVSWESCGELSNGFVQFGIRILLLTAHFLGRSYIDVDLYVVPTQFWPSMFGLCFPIFPS